MITVQTTSMQIIKTNYDMVADQMDLQPAVYIKRVGYETFTRNDSPTKHVFVSKRHSYTHMTYQGDVLTNVEIAYKS